jgi:hypothetical protein
MLQSQRSLYDALQSVLIPEGGAVYRDFLSVLTASKAVFTPLSLPLAFPATKDFLIGSRNHCC